MCVNNVIIIIITALRSTGFKAGAKGIIIAAHDQSLETRSYDNQGGYEIEDLRKI